MKLYLGGSLFPKLISFNYEKVDLYGFIIFEMPVFSLRFYFEH